MSDSKFLKFQDIDNDGLIDVCDDDLLTPPAPCKAPCVPDPFRLIPDWKTLTIDDPFLNVKICHFQVTKETPYDRTASPELIQQNNAQGGALDAEIDRQLEEKFKEFEDEAIASILDIGPEGGDGGGELIAYGSPEQVAKSKSSYTAKYLKPLLD